MTADTAANDTAAPPPMRLKFFPVSFFAMVMGLTGLAMALNKFGQAMGLDRAVAAPAFFFAIAVFIVLAGFYIAKFLRHREAVIAELNHPVMMAFFPAISISLLLIAICFAQGAPALGRVVWGVGTALHLILTLHVVRSWIHHDKFRIGHLNPAWFIPAVGNVIVPIAGAQLGYVEISWFFFAVGISFWVILLVLVFNRVLFHDPLPAMLLPTLFILIAPPAVGFVAYTWLNGAQVDAFARVLYYLALFFTLLMLIELPRFAKLPFFLSWWAYSFPAAAITVATYRMHELQGYTFYLHLGHALLAALVVLIAILLYKTARAVQANQICVERKH